MRADPVNKHRGFTSCTPIDLIGDAARWLH